jgi:CRISPR system Cascade subunit CasE
MYISFLLINVGDNPDRPRPGRLWLKNLYHVHQRLCMAFPSSGQKDGDPLFLKPYNPNGFQHVHGERSADQSFLFRIDPQAGGSPIIIVQSAIKPDWSYAFQNADYLLAAKPEVKTFGPIFEKGQNLKFRLLANPVRRASKNSVGSDGKPLDEKWKGKRVPVPADQLYQWLSRKGGSGGFLIIKESMNIQPGYIYFNKPEKKKPDQKPEKESEDEEKEKKSTRLFSVRYDGILEVTDSEKFRATIIKGIGPAKAFGFGLLSVARVRQ